MRTMGIRELKAGLSKVLRDVQRGDTVLVTDRGRVIAELRRPDAAQSNDSPQERALARLAASGHLRIAEPRAAPYPRSPAKSRKGLAQGLLDDGRNGR